MTASEFWRGRIAQLPERFRLASMGQQRPRRQESLEQPLSPVHTELLQRVAGGRPMETFVLWLTAVQISVAHQLGRQSVVLHCPPMGQPEASGAPSSVPLVLEAMPTATLRDTVMRTDQLVAESYLHARELTALGPQDSAWMSSDLLVESTALHGRDASRKSAYALHLALEDGAGGLPPRMVATFDAQVLPSWLVSVLIERSLRVLASFTEPTRPIASLDLRIPREEERLLRDFAVSPSPPPWHTTLAEAFTAQARRWPERAAVIHRDRTLSYRALEERASQLAYLLRTDYGVSRGARVAFCLPKSEEAIISILGILQAGAAYVPIDPAVPPARRQVMLEDAAPAVLIVDSTMILEFEGFAGPLVAIDLQLEGVTGTLVPSEADATPEDPAYAIFTSGSMGRPKAVLVEHRAILNYLAWKRAYYGLDETTVTLQLAPLVFDSAVSDVFTTLLSGGTLVLMAGQDRLDPGIVSGTLLKHGVTIFAIVPSLYRALIEQLPALPALRVITVAGERVPAALVALHRARFPQVRLINEYGPTEGSVCATVHDLSEHEGGDPPIGRPIDNVGILLLQGQELVPTGAAGEICIAGVGLARGYLHQPALTAEKFVPHPFSEGERLYRTGDLGRWRFDGLLDFIGRLDAQVKIRGNRIELGDVEEALRRHPAIRDVAVVARGQGESAELVAYIVSGGSVDEVAMRTHLLRLLPEWMWPSQVVELPALPLNINGKVDKALLPPPPPRLSAASASRPPQSELEHRLARLWSEVLGRNVGDVEASFFEIGGHSLKAIQLAASIHRELGVAISLRDVFQHSTIRALAELIGQGREQLPTAIPRQPWAESYPVSNAQRRLWVLESLREGKDTAYTIPESFVWEGDFDEACFDGAAQALADRHGVLRTSFLEQNGEPRQRLDPQGRLSARYVDLTAAPDVGAEVARLAREQADRPFDLGTAPLARLTVARTARDRRIVLLTLHHIIGDGWSLRVLLRDLAELYQALREDRPPALPELSIQHTDYAAWQNTWLAREDSAGHRAYWQARLAGAAREPCFPPDRPRPPRQTIHGALRSFTLGAAETAALRRLSHSQDASLFMVLVTTLKAYIHRVTGLRDILLGTPIAGRLHPDLENQVGLFLNTLVLRDAVSGAQSFSALVEQVRQTLLEAYEHQDCPFDLVVSQLNAPRDLSRHPIFDVMVTFEDAEEETIRFGPLRRARGLEEGDLTAAPTANTKFDLSVAFTDRGSSIEVSLHYNTDLFTHEHMSRFEARFVRLVRSATAAPHERLEELELLPEEERLRLLPSPEATRPVEPDEDRSIDSYFREQVRRSPEALAIGGATPLTYAELDRRARGVALALRTQVGLAPDEVVALLCERSAAYVVGALGILKADSAYLPIDPRQPAQRIELILRESRARAVLVEGDRHRELVASLSLPILDIEQCPPTEAGPESHGSSRQQMYVIFTSGTTGVPKGVSVEQRSVLNLVRWHARTSAVGPQARVALCSNIMFDASVLDLWPSLLQGASVHPVGDDELEPENLARVFAERQITHAFLTTPLCQLLCEHPGLELPPGLRLFTGGDALSLSRPPPGHLVNVYGPTETTVFVTTYLVPPTAQEKVAPLGRPIDRTWVYVLDSRLRPVPLGVEGQIAIGGAGVGRGYLGSPAFTAERFVPDISVPGARMFLTGDMGLWREDGVLEFRGRRDHQVKIRGHRVELAEVEHALHSHPDVSQAAVITQGEGPDRRLVAYLALRESAADQTDSLLSFLRTKLPAYMLPSQLVTLEHLPLNANGKIDRAALQALMVEPLPATGHRLTERQELLATLWAEVLERGSVGVDEDFFELGGDSLRAMKLAARVREAFGAPVSLRLLLDHPTVQAMAEALESNLAYPEEAGPSLPSPRPEPDRDTAPLTVTQETIWRLARALPSLPVFNVVWNLHLAGPLKLETLQAALTAIVQANPLLRTVFPREGEAPVQRVLPPGNLELPLVPLEDLSESEQRAALLKCLEKAAAERFALDKAPPVRFTLVRLEAEHHLLLITLHHIICDGWTQDLFIRGLSESYAACAEGRSPPPAPELQYGDFARWQRRCLAENLFAGQFDYWRKRLATAPLPPLLTQAAPQIQGAQTAVSMLSADWPLELAQAARSFGRGEGCTPFMTLLAGLEFALASELNLTDVWVGTNIANRSRHTERVHGLFANTVVLRTNLSGAPTARQLLRQVRETLLEATANQDLPFELVSAEIERLTGCSRQRLAPIMFLYQGSALSPATAGGLSISSLDGQEGAGAGALTASELVFAAREDEERLEVSLLYKPALFGEARAARILERWRQILEAMLRAPDASPLATGHPSAA